jgi:hypothetical protein
MEEPKFIFNPTGSELTIRTGDAEEIQYAKPISIDGVIDAPAQFLAGKFVEAHNDNSHLRIYGQEGKLELYVNDTDPNSMHVIKGSLKKSTDLATFQINKDTRFSVGDFLRFIKVSRFFFASREAHGKLVTSLQKWSGNIDTAIRQHNDNKGNSDFQLEQKVRLADGFVDKFDLLIPIFQGDTPVQFTVEIGLDPKNAAILIYLFSDDLIELEAKRRAQLMETALNEFEKYTFSKVVIN